MKEKVCHISTVHKPDDIRIYQKEALSLAEKYLVYYINSNDKNIKELKNVNLVTFSKSKNRIKRIVRDNFRAYKLALKLDCDVYHFHDFEFIYYAYLLKLKRKKVIYDSHEDLPRAIMSKYWIPYILRKPTSFLVEKAEEFFTKKFDYVITATPFIKQRFKKIKINTEVINNYPILNELISSNGSNNKLSQVAYVGGLSTIRGVNQLAEASLNTVNTIKIAGNVTNLPGENKLELLGQLNREEVKDLLSESVAGIVTFLPEPNHINAQPNKMFEYMSASLPVICSNFDQWKMLIDENKNGITVDPNNPKDISKAIDYLIENPNIALEMGRNSRRAIETKYNWETESEKLIKIYDQILKEN